MNKFDKDILQRLLDYHLHQDAPRQRQEIENLLATDPKVRQLNDALKNMLAPLSRLPHQAPPAGLAQRTLQFIDQHRQAETLAQHSLKIANTTPDPASAKPNRGRMAWVMTNLKDVITVAACLAIFVLAYQPGARYIRRQQQQQLCAAGMRNIGVALADYLNDNHGSLPYVTQPPGTTWWDVASQTPGQYSNTRNLYLLVRTGYLAPKWFVCPAVQSPDHNAHAMSPDETRQLADFISRGGINYSFRLVGPNQKLDGAPAQPILTDQSPLFSNFNSNLQKELILDNRDDLLHMNSPNHQQRGQNILHADGHVRFYINRTPTPTRDDIFTIQNITRYHGTEQPNPNDVFIAP